MTHLRSKYECNVIDADSGVLATLVAAAVVLILIFAVSPFLILHICMPVLHAYTLLQLQTSLGAIRCSLQDYIDVNSCMY